MRTIITVAILCVGIVALADGADLGKNKVAPVQISTALGKGVLTASSKGANKNEGPEKAFDGSKDSKYCTVASTFWLQFQLAEGPKRVRSYALTSPGDNKERDPREWALQGSNDGETWKDLDTRQRKVFSERLERLVFAVAKPGDYAYYRLSVTKNDGVQVSQIAELELLTAEADG